MGAALQTALDTNDDDGEKKVLYSWILRTLLTSSLLHLENNCTLSCSLLAVTQIRGDSAVGSSPPSPLRYVASIFITRKIHQFLSLFDPRRIVSTHAMIGALDS